MPIAQRTATSGTAASGAGFTITLPGSIEIGEFLIVAVTNAGTTGPNAPTGWTRIYSVSAGSGQCHSVYTAKYDAGLTLSFTNVASVAAWVCNAFFQAGWRVAIDTTGPTTEGYIGIINTTNATNLPTSGIQTGPTAGDYEAMTYGWTSAATIATPAAGTTIDRTQANSTSCSVSIAHNNTTSLGANTVTTSFTHTLSATNNRKSGVAILLKTVPIPGEIPAVQADGTSTVEGALRAPRIDVAGLANGVATETGQVNAKRLVPNASALGRATVSVSIARARALTGATVGRATNTATMGRKRPVIASAAGTAATSTATMQRKRAIVAVSTGMSTAVGFLYRKRALIAVSAGKGTTATTILNKVKNLTVNPSNGRAIVVGRVFNRIMVVWTGSTFALEGPHPVALWDGTQFQVSGDEDMVIWREPNDYFDLVIS